MRRAALAISNAACGQVRHVTSEIRKAARDNPSERGGSPEQAEAAHPPATHAATSRIQQQQTRPWPAAWAREPPNQAITMELRVLVSVVLSRGRVLRRAQEQLRRLRAPLERISLC